MSAIPILLADAIAAAINTAVGNGVFAPQSFTARRSYPDWDDDFKDLDSLSLDVVWVSSDGNGAAAELDSADTLQTDPSVDIAIRKRFEASDRDQTTGRLKNTSVDPLVKLVEQVYELFVAARETPLTLAPGLVANWVDCTIKTHCDYGRLRQGYFLGVVRVRWDVSKAVN
jgi:hypothetical protein